MGGLVSTGLGMSIAMRYLEVYEPEFLGTVSLYERKKYQLEESENNKLMIRHPDGSVTFEAAEPFQLTKWK